jgi:hypothetical protein
VEPPSLCMVMELCDHSLHHLLHATNAYLSPQQLTRIAVRSWLELLRYTPLCSLWTSVD